jgi:hypothetical protein
MGQNEAVDLEVWTMGRRTYFLQACQPFTTGYVSKEEKKQ